MQNRKSHAENARQIELSCRLHGITTYAEDCDYLRPKLVVSIAVNISPSNRIVSLTQQLSRHVELPQEFVTQVFCIRWVGLITLNDLKVIRSDINRQLVYTAVLAGTSQPFLANSLYAVARTSVCLSVTLVHPTQPVKIYFRQCFYAIWYRGHPLTSTENITKIVPEEPLGLVG